MAWKSWKEYSVDFLVEGEKLKLRICLRGLHVLLRTRSAQRLGSPHLAVVLRLNLTELMPSGFFCPQPWFLWRSKHIFRRKIPVFCVTQLTCVTHVTLNRVEVHRLNSQHLAMVQFGCIGHEWPSRGARFLFSIFSSFFLVITFKEWITSIN